MLTISSTLSSRPPKLPVLKRPRSIKCLYATSYRPTVTRPYATPHDHSRFQADNSDFFSFIGFTPYTSSTRFLQGRFHYCFPGRGSNPINWPNFTQIRPDLMKNRSILEILGGPGRDNRGLAWLNRHEWLWMVVVVYGILTVKVWHTKRFRLEVEKRHSILCRYVKQMWKWYRSILFINRRMIKKSETCAFCKFPRDANQLNYTVQSIRYTWFGIMINYILFMNLSSKYVDTYHYILENASIVHKK